MEKVVNWIGYDIVPKQLKIILEIQKQQTLSDNLQLSISKEMEGLS